METIDGDRQPTLTSLALEVERARNALSRLEAIYRLHEMASDVERLAVDQARAEGATWSSIGASLRVSKQAASKRFGPSKPDGAPKTKRSPRQPQPTRRGWEVALPGRRAILHIRPRQSPPE